MHDGSPMLMLLNYCKVFREFSKGYDIHIFIFDKSRFKDVVSSGFQFSNSDRYKVKCHEYNLF